MCLQDSVEHCIIGVTILSQLTNEINQVSVVVNGQLSSLNYTLFRLGEEKYRKAH